MEGQPGVHLVDIGWKAFREINTVIYDPDRITVEKMAELLKEAGRTWGRLVVTDARHKNA